MRNLNMSGLLDTLEMHVYDRHCDAVAQDAFKNQGQTGSISCENEFLSLGRSDLARKRTHTAVVLSIYKL